LSELCRRWSWRDDTLRAYFIDEPGVSKIIRPEVLGNRSVKPKRQYVTLRIPLHVAQKMYARSHPGESTPWMPPEDGPPSS
jgi:hypothetical protein